MAYKTKDSTEHLKLFTKKVRSNLEKYKDFSADELTELQRQQVEGLAQIEQEFRDELIKTPLGVEAYAKFVDFVQSNVLHARPYFRERSATFNAYISPALKSKSPEELYPFAINYHFIKFLRNLVEIPEGSFVWGYIDRIETAREELVLMNIPLILNRATLFWNKTSKSHLSFMDLVQIGVEGLIAGIDKYAGKYTKVWRSVAIGRCVGNYIQEYNQTMLHFFPKDKRKLYRANKTLSKGAKSDIPLEKVVEAVNKDAVGNQKTDLFEIQQLMAAASITSFDNPDVAKHNNIDLISEEETVRPDCRLERLDLRRKASCAIIDLTLFERKFIRLKGVDL